MSDRSGVRLLSLPGHLEVTARAFHLYEFVEGDGERWRRCVRLVCAMEAVLDRHLGAMPPRDAVIAAVAIGLEHDSVLRAHILEFEDATELLKDETWAQINSAAATLMVRRAMSEMGR